MRAATAPGAIAAATHRAPVVPALCGALRRRVTGRVASAAATELSGLALSHAQPGVLWSHNDSGDRPRVLALSRDGRLRADVAVTGAASVDWEDIAVGPDPAGGDALYIADTGDNLARRTDIAVLRVPEPDLSGPVPAASAPATRLALRYPDGPRDAEALLVDPATGAIVVVSKSFGGAPGVYVAARPSAPAVNLLRRRARLSLGVGEAITAGDVSADGRTIALRSYGRAYVWRRRVGETIAQALRRRPCSPPTDLFVEGQGEALALTAHGGAFYTVPEGSGPPIRRYAPTGHVAAR